MKSFMEQLAENIERFPERIALKSAAANRGISYGELDEYSGKVYAYLKQNNIGKEDMVLIRMPRGTRAIVSIIGVWKAGAAYTIVEDTYAPDRIEFIRKDCNCKLVLNVDVFEEMMQTEPLSGFEKTEPHDAAFAVYTSGTTGNPKGVLHEYGKLSQIAYAQQVGTFAIPPEGSILAVIPPLNFVAAILTILRVFTLGNCAYILPYEVVKNPVKYAKFLIDEKVAETFMPPSFIKIYKDVSPYLCNVFVGGEACNGVFLEGPCLVNSYASSESGMAIATFVIDKPYEKTPAGNNGFGLEYLILDQNGNRVPDGEMGEICFFNEFTRGYINLPDKTKEVFVDGIYHMGDLGYINENGDLMVCGRKDDMIKINGNRIEPAEIECAIRDNLDIKNVVVKGFNEDDRSFICAYLIEKELEEKGLLKDSKLRFTSDEMKERLQKRLPDYMIPTYYVIMDEFPLNANGKIDKKNIKAPLMDDYAENYEAPATEIEKYLCELFANVLKKDRVGVNDDFYLIGGDSLSSMELVSDCELDGITNLEIYKYRTPRNIANYYTEHIEDKIIDKDVCNARELEHSQPLLPEMQTVIDCQEFSPDSVMWNLPVLFRLKDDIDVLRLCNAIDKVFKHHPVYRTQFYYDNNSEMKQRYLPDSYEEIKVIDIGEDDFSLLKKSLVKPYSVDALPLCRKAIYRTENNSYLFIDHYHIITDGISLNIVFKQIVKCYNDEKYVLPKDYYYLMLRDEEEKRQNGEYDEIKQYYKDFYQKYFVENDTKVCIKPDHKVETLSESLKIGKTLSVSKEYINNNQNIFTGNEFFIMACLLAIAKYNNEDNAYIQWVYNGRNSKDKINMTGLLYRSLPVALIIDDKKSIRELFDEILSQIQYTTAHDSLKVNCIGDPKLDQGIFFLFQKGIYNKNGFPLAEEELQVEIDEKTSEALIEMMVIDIDDEPYECTIEYDTAVFEHETIVKFLDYFDEIAGELSNIENLQEVYVKDLIDKI